MNKTLANELWKYVQGEIDILNFSHDDEKREEIISCVKILNKVSDRAYLLDCDSRGFYELLESEIGGSLFDDLTVSRFAPFEK